MKKKIHPFSFIKTTIHTNGSTFFGGVGQAQFATLAFGLRLNPASPVGLSDPLAFSSNKDISPASLWHARTSAYAFLNSLLASKSGLVHQRLRVLSPKKEHLSRLLNLSGGLGSSEWVQAAFVRLASRQKTSPLGLIDSPRLFSVLDSDIPSLSQRRSDRLGDTSESALSKFKKRYSSF
jgi:hypothetical protein